MLTRRQRAVKRALDLVLTLLALALGGWLIPLLWIVAALDTRQSGFFRQERVGREGRIFRVIKLRTMRRVEGVTTTVTTSRDPRVTPIGAWLRRLKLDELPQFLNVLCGQMSLVGPRPDVPGFADRVEGADRAILSIRPGITGPATLVIFDEEELLAECADAERYNSEVLYPAKVALNREYVEQYALVKDLLYIAATALPLLRAPVLAALGHPSESEALRAVAAESLPGPSAVA